MRSWKISAGDHIITRSSIMEKVTISQKAISYALFDLISNRLDRPVKNILSIMGIAQTTYNKKKVENSLLDSRDSELILMITELLDNGLEVFNNEKEKFQRWLKNQTYHQKAVRQKILRDTTTSIEAVNYPLNRIEIEKFAL